MGEDFRRARIAVGRDIFLEKKMKMKIKLESVLLVQKTAPDTNNDLSQVHLEKEIQYCGN